jgi:4-hydroxy-tetrahydrodipicolinate synthase
MRETPWPAATRARTALFAEPNPAVIKGVLHALGKIPSPAVRLPLLPARQDAVRAAIGLLGQANATVGRP